MAGASAPIDIYERLTHDEFADEAERVNLERDLIAALTAAASARSSATGCGASSTTTIFPTASRTSLIDSQAGFNSPVFVRTVKLKDFPWNGWLRLGIDAGPTAAWNPVAGFTDAAGRLVWSAVGDNAFLPIPYNSRWVRKPRRDPAKRRPQRQAVDPHSGRRHGAGTRDRPARAGRRRRRRDRQGHLPRLASAFHDGTEMEPADFSIPMRWRSAGARIATGEGLRSGDRGGDGG